MVWSLSEVGIDRQDILRGIDALASGRSRPRGVPRNAYLFDHRNSRIWGLKQVLHAVSDLKGVKLKPGFDTNFYRGDLARLGFSYIVFDDHESQRVAGVLGQDPSVFLEPHVLYQSDGAAIPNGLRGFGPQATTEPELPTYCESRISRLHLVLDRRGPAGRVIKDILGLTCEGCGLDAEAAFGRQLAMSCTDAHHLWPVAEMPAEGRTVDPSDFAILCATCHRIIHRLDRPDDIDGLRKIASKPRQS